MLGNVGLSFQEQIDDDVEIFLPDDAESTDLLLEVREEWSTDLAIIYVQTSNAALGGGRGENISDEAILREMSWVEGDADNADGGARSRGIDWSKTDHGRDDGILWILSPAQDIKEDNSADGRFHRSACNHGINTRLPLTLDCDVIPGHLADFIPGMASSKVLERRGPPAVVEQLVSAVFLFFCYAIDLVAASTEFKPLKIEVTMLQGIV